MEQSLLERARVRPGDVVRDIEPVQVPAQPKEEQKPSWLKSLGAALRSETSLGVAYNRIREDIAADGTGPRQNETLDQYLLRIESFDVDKAIKDRGLQERIGRIPHEFHERLYEARNPDHLEAILSSVERRVADSETLQAAGLGKSITSQIAVGLLDPVDWLVTVGTGGFGKAATTGSRAVRAAKAGASAAAANMAVEAVIATDDATRDASDIAAAGVLGLALGGGLGAIGKGDDARIRAAADKVYRTEVSRVDAPKAEQQLDLPLDHTPKGTQRELFPGAELGRAPEQPRVDAPLQLDLGLAAPASREQQLNLNLQFDPEKFLRRSPHVAVMPNGSLWTAMNSAGQFKALRSTTSPLTYLDTPVADNRAARRAEAAIERGLARGMERTLAREAKEAQRELNRFFDQFPDGQAELDLGPGLLGEMQRDLFGDLPVQRAPERDAPAQAELPLEATPKAAEHERVEVDNVPSPQAASASAAATPLDDPEWWGTKLALPTTFARSLLSDKVHPKVRSLAGKLMDALPRADDEVREITAEREATSLYTRFVGRFYLATEPEFQAWAKSNGYGFMRRHLGSEAQQRFNIEVGRAIRGAQQVSAEAKAAAKKVSALFDELRERAKAARIEGFDDIGPNPRYLPRSINYARFHEMWQQVGKHGMIELVAGAIRAKGTPPELAGRIAKAYVEGAKRRMLDTDLGFLQGISEDSVERLRYYLPSDDPSLVDDVIAYLKRFRKEGNPDGGRLAQAKHRIDLDENYSAYINGQFVRFADILHEDAGMLFDRYAKTITGWIGLSNRAGLRSEADYARFKADIAGDDSSFANFKDLDAVVDLILGRSLDADPTGHINRAASLLRKINFARTMGQAGLASISEVGNIVAYAGMKNMLMHVPGLRSLWRGMRAGQLDKELEEELRWLTGVGTRMLSGRGKAGIDDLGLQVEHALYDKADRIIDPIARSVSYAGLLGPVNEALQVLASKSFVQKMASWARGAQIDSGSRLRIRDAGIHDGQLNRIMEEFRKHSVFDEAGALVRINWQKWDQDLLDDFTFALDRLTYRAVQENDIGSSAPWMHKWWGKTLMQFRGFISNAYTKQTLYALRYRDAQAFTAFATTMFVGGLVYMMRTWTNYAHDDEQLEKRLSLDKVAFAAFNNSGYASVIPMAVDTVAADVLRFDPVFSFARTSGLAGGLLLGNPTVELVDNTIDTAALPARLLRDDYQFSQEDFTRATRLLPYNNLLGIRNIIAVMNEELPERSLEDDYWR